MSHQSFRRLTSDRRTFLRGAAGSSLILPAFASLSAAAPGAVAQPLAVTSTGSPLRLACVYIPNGVQQDRWWPEGDETNFAFNETMQALEPLRQSVQVLNGMDHVNAEGGPDGAGDHARANATFLTGVRARKTAGTDINLGISVDQLVANRLHGLTRYRSMELTCDHIRKSGRCDSGYSCAYQYNISWSGPRTPMTPEPNPRNVFERLFGATKETAAEAKRRRAARQSVLDFVRDDARSLSRQLASDDRHKLEEYLNGVREIEQRIDQAESFGPFPEAPVAIPEGIPDDYGEHMDLMFDLMALAFQTDSTRVATLMLAHDGSNRPFPEIDVAEGHHHLTHNQERADYRAKIGKIDQKYMGHFVRFLKKLQATKDTDGRSVLDNSMIVYGSGNADADRHTHTDLPVILAGQGGGSLRSGRWLDLRSQPMSNLLLAIANRMGLHDVDQFGDSTDRLDAI